MMSDEELEKAAEEIAGTVAAMVDFTQALELLKRTAAGDPCQLSQSQAKSIINLIQIQRSEIQKLEEKQ